MRRGYPDLPHRILDMSPSPLTIGLACLLFVVVSLDATSAAAQRRRTTPVTLASNQNVEFLVDGVPVGSGMRIEVRLTNESHEVVARASGYADKTAWLHPPFVTATPYQFVFTIQDQLPQPTPTSTSAPTPDSTPRVVRVLPAEPELPPPAQAEPPPDPVTFDESFFVVRPEGTDAENLYSTCASSVASALLSAGTFIERNSPEVTRAISECVRDTSSPEYGQQCELSMAQTQVDVVLVPEITVFDDRVLVAVSANRPLTAGNVWRQDRLVDDEPMLLEVRSACEELGHEFARSGR